MINCATEVSSSGLFWGYSEDIKHRINNLSHSSEWNMRDVSLSGYIFTCLRLVKIWPPAREISHVSIGYTLKARLLNDLFNRAPKARGE